MSMNKMDDIAKEIGLNAGEFNDCLTSGKYRERVESNYNEFHEAGIFATPTFFVNGNPIVGLKNFADYEKIVVDEIKGACEHA